MGSPPHAAALHQLIAAPAPTRSGQYLAGLSVPWLGLRVLLHRPGLWKYAIMPIVLNLLITAIAILAMLVMAAGIVALLNWLTSGWQGTWFYVAIVLQVLGAAAMVMLCIAAAAIVWRLLSGILCGYFYSRLAARVERELGVGEDELCDVTLWAEIRDALADLGWLLLSLLLALLVALIPLIGPPLALAYSRTFRCSPAGGRSSLTRWRCADWRGRRGWCSAASMRPRRWAWGPSCWHWNSSRSSGRCSWSLPPPVQSSCTGKSRKLLSQQSSRSRETFGGHSTLRVFPELSRVRLQTLWQTLPIVAFVPESLMRQSGV
jgi:hypothetical protein